MGKMRECFKLGIMGCLPSRRREKDASSTEDEASRKDVRQSRSSAGDAAKQESGDKPSLAPTIQMVNEETLKLLQEIGELRVFHTANNTDHNKDIARHHDIILALENPTKASGVTLTVSSASNVK